MDFKYNEFEILTNKNIDETKIVTISDLNWDFDTTKSDINDLIVKINDILPKYIFILGNVCTYDKLKDDFFKEKLTYFFKLLSCIGKSFIVFGNRDYLIEENKNKFYTNIDSLLNYYNKQLPYYINNYITTDNDFNIIGFNKNFLTYNNLIEARRELLNLIDKINNTIDDKKFNVLITHYELDHLKLEKELFETFDLILTGTNHKMVKKKILNIPKDEKVISEEKVFIKTGGVSKGEIGFVKIKRL